MGSLMTRDILFQGSYTFIESTDTRVRVGDIGDRLFGTQ